MDANIYTECLIKRIANATALLQWQQAPTRITE